MKLFNSLFYGVAKSFYWLMARCLKWIHPPLTPVLKEFWTHIDAELLDRENASNEPQEQTMFEALLDFKQTVAREIMVPRIELDAVRISDSVDKIISIVQKEGRSRIPVFEDKIDNIVGIVYAKDILRKNLVNQSKNYPIEKLMRPAFFVPETKNVVDLLQEMRQKRTHIAIVIDEYGGTAGILTMEDLIEEIIGEVQDEYDKEEEKIVAVDDSSWMIDAKMPIDDINDALDLEIPTDEDYDTLAGYILFKLGKIPDEKEKLEAEGFTCVVMKSDEKSIEKVRVTKHLTEESVDETETSEGE